MARYTGTACGAGRCLPLRAWGGGALRGGRVWSAAPGASPRRAPCLRITRRSQGALASAGRCAGREGSGGVPRAAGAAGPWRCREAQGADRERWSSSGRGLRPRACVEPWPVSRWGAWMRLRSTSRGQRGGALAREGAVLGIRCWEVPECATASPSWGSSRPWQGCGQSLRCTLHAGGGVGRPVRRCLLFHPVGGAVSWRGCPGSTRAPARTVGVLPPCPGSLWQVARAPGGTPQWAVRLHCGNRCVRGHRGGSLGGRPGWPGCVGDPCSGPPPVPGAVRSLRAGRQVVPASEVAHQRGWACRLCAGRGAVALGQVTCRAGLVIVCSALPSPQAQHMGRPRRARVRVATGSFGWQGGCTAAPGCALGGQGRGIPLLPAPRASGCGAPA